MVQYMHMSQGLHLKSTVHTASKDVLARCMATEDITVVHRADVPSAYFDTKNRELCLPIWQDMTNEVYDMLVGHEVSHALHTPAEGWQDFIGKGKGSGMRHMFVNVVEDARIERLIKDKFPGIRRDFASAYKTLHTQDLFELGGVTISDMPLIDRLNLYFKLGLFGLEDVRFSADEKPYVKRMAEATTFEQVVELARELYEKQVEENEENDEQGQSQPQDGEQGDDSGEGQQNPFGDTPEDSDDSEDSSGDGASDDDGDDDYGSGSQNQETDEDSDESGDESGDSDTGDESGDSDTGDDSDGDESGDSDGESGDSQSNMDYDDYTNDKSAAGSTQRNFEQNVDHFRDESGTEYRYHTLPEMNLDNIIVDYPVIESMWQRLQSSEDYDSNQHHVDQRIENASNLQSFLNQSKATVNQMVQQFQMKQAADASHKTRINRTGVLNTTTMINYRWSEDIFRKNETQPDGKNHGMVMYLDWSGSMNGILQDTVEQLLVLVEFCRKVNIPYEVYAFSSNRYYPQLEGLDRYSDEFRDAHANLEENSKQFDENGPETDCRYHRFQLYNFLSSRMNNRDYKTALTNLWNLTYAQSHYRSCHYPRCLDTGCTPLNEAIVSALEIVPAFQRANGIQIVNTVFLTDGDGHSMGLQGYRYNSSKGDKDILRDSTTRKTYDVGNVRNAETMTLLTLLKDRTGCNTIGIRLHCARNIKNMRYDFWGHDDKAFQDACKSFTKKNYCTVPSAYDEYFIVQGNLKVEFDALEGLQEGATNTQIKNAFLKGNNTKKSSRVIATQMVNIFATQINDIICGGLNPPFK